MDMDYKAMWEILRKELEADHAFYTEGKGCSTNESIHGSILSAGWLRAMDMLEIRYRKD